jgi:HlyD family secretion protein
MSGDRKRRIRGLASVAVLVALATAVAVSTWLGYRPWRKSGPSLEELPRSVVRRADLRMYLTAPGQVESSKKTQIICELENLQIRSQGHESNVGGSSTILRIIPDGSLVKEGDLLCQLDASSYEELVRQQQIKVEECRSTKLQTELDLQVAEMGVYEYQDGLRRQDEQDYRGRIALAKSEVQRAADRLAWSTRMLQKGYSSAGQIATERSTLQRATLALEQVQGEFTHFQRFTAPITLRTLESTVEGARANLLAQIARLERSEERLKHYMRQVELCTIRAPHDGLVIYANDPRRSVVIEEGMVVRQKQNLFYLPDLADMEVRTVLNESVVERVRDGLPAKIRIESLPGRILEGHVLYVNPLPLTSEVMAGSDAKNYVSMVKLDSIPEGLRPGMSAEVQIVTGTRSDALIIPAEALAYEDGHEVCYVAVDEGVERREVTVSGNTQDFLEVTQGLEEGEEVFLDPVGHNLSSATAPAPASVADPAAAHEATAVTAVSLH